MFSIGSTPAETQPQKSNLQGQVILKTSQQTKKSYLYAKCLT